MDRTEVTEHTGMHAYRGEKKHNQRKQRNKCRNNNNRFNKLKFKKEKRGNSTKLQKPNIEAEVYTNNKKK